MNIELFRRVQEKILAKPKRFEMDDWFCGTTACIAGHAALLSGHRRRKHSSLLVVKNGVEQLVDRAALKELRIDRLMASRLFYAGNWPDQFRYAYDHRTTTPQQRAQIASDRIDHFIATKGRE